MTAHGDRKYRKGKRAKMARQVMVVSDGVLRELKLQMADLDERTRALTAAKELCDYRLGHVMGGTPDHWHVHDLLETVRRFLQRLDSERAQKSEEIREWRRVRSIVTKCPDCRGSGSVWKSGILHPAKFVCARCCGNGVLVAGVD